MGLQAMRPPKRLERQEEPQRRQPALQSLLLLSSIPGQAQMQLDLHRMAGLHAKMHTPNHPGPLPLEGRRPSGLLQRIGIVIENRF